MLIGLSVPLPCADLHGHYCINEMNSQIYSALEHSMDIALPETARKIISDNATTSMNDSKV